MNTVVFEHITKRFPGTTALDDVSFSIAAGEIHVVVGANGAGKSTLMHILGGTTHADQGTVYLNGEPTVVRDPHHARLLGVGVVYQELRLCDNLTVAENLSLGREEIGAMGSVNARRSARRASTALAAIGAEIDPATRVRDLPLSQKQLVEIARAIDQDCRVLILDEPTSSLTIRETQILFEKLRALRAEGVAVIFISHRLEEIFMVADRISVLRDGRYLGTFPAAEISRERVVELIAGRSLAEELKLRGASLARSEVALEVRGLTREPGFRDVSFALHSGEILGLYGLQGAGRTEVLEAIAGIRPAQSGTVLLAGQPASVHTPSAAISQGIAMVPEDRRRAGLFLGMDVKENICVAVPDKVSRLKVVLRGLVSRVASSFVERLGIKVTGLSQSVATLSGGNQQKVVLSRWLATEPRVLLLDEVTRGIDVGAKAEIYGILKKLRQGGLAILLVSSELPEILAECDRTLVMWSGRLVGDIPGVAMSKEAILPCAMGLGTGGPPPVTNGEAGGSR